MLTLTTYTLSSMYTMTRYTERIQLRCVLRHVRSLLAPSAPDMHYTQATKGGETAVMAAAKNGHTDTLRALLEAGALHSTLTRAGLNALMLACRHNRVRRTLPCRVHAWGWR